MEYADYAYYTDSYHGSAVTEQEWPRLSIQASAYLDMITMGRIQRLKEIPDAVKNAVCAVVEIKKAQQSQGNITSEKDGNYAVSYTARTKNEQAEEQYRAAYESLACTGLLYAGVKMKC